MTDRGIFLANHVDKTHFNKALAELVFVLQPTSADEVMDGILQLCADQKYRQYLQGCPKNFIIGLDPYPKIRTTSDPYGLRTPADQTIRNRRQPLIKIYAKMTRIATYHGSPMFVDGDYPWLDDVQAVVTATGRAYTKQSTFNLGKLAVIQLCEALGKTELKTQYFVAYNALSPIEATDDGPQPLSKEEVANIRQLNGDVIDRATALIENKGAQASDRELGVILEALAIESMYGCSPKHEPLRNDWINIVFKGPETDTQSANYISIEPDTVTLTVNIAKKVGRLREPLVVNLSESSPRLASLLRKVHPIAVAVQGTDEPYVLWSKKKALTASQYTTRLANIWIRLGFDPGVGRRGCNGARHASVAEDRKRRHLTKDERAEEQDQAKRRCSSVKMSEEAYAQS